MRRWFPADVVFGHSRGPVVGRGRARSCSTRVHGAAPTAGPSHDGGAGRRPGDEPSDRRRRPNLAPTGRGSVVDALDRPTPPLDVHQHGPAVGQLQLEPGPAPVALRVPPALVDRPRAGPGHDLHRRAARPTETVAGSPSRWPRPLTPGTARRRCAPTTPTGSGGPQGRGRGRAPGRARAPSTPGGRRAVGGEVDRGGRHPRDPVAPGLGRPAPRARTRPRRRAGPAPGPRPAAARSSTTVSPPQKPSWRPRGGDHLVGSQRQPGDPGRGPDARRIR